VIELLPDSNAQRWRTFVDEIYTKYQREGWQAAQAEFMASLINVLIRHIPLISMKGFLIMWISSSNMNSNLSLGIYPALRASETMV
jgi:hypothetical protein